MSPAEDDDCSSDWYLGIREPEVEVRGSENGNTGRYIITLEY
jgi:hypothetical protein